MRSKFGFLIIALACVFAASVLAEGRDGAAVVVALVGGWGHGDVPEDAAGGAVERE
jgi:hypothetical protein